MMSRLARRATAWVGAAAFVFAQLAVSAYACPKVETAGDVQVAPAVHPCEHTDAVPTNLCSKHCHDSAQAPTQAPEVCAHFTASFTVAVYAPVAAAWADAPADPALFHATSPPATLRNCCLRI